MPPKGLPQPTQAERDAVVGVDWPGCRSGAGPRPAPKNGAARWGTVPQYRNTLQDLLLIEDDVQQLGSLPDAMRKKASSETETRCSFRRCSPQAYFEIAEDALNRALVDPSKKPVIQDFRRGIWPEGC